MTVSVTLPAYTPTSWELVLPGYPVITNSFRGAFFPDLLGSLPSESRWRLTFKNRTDAEALALLLPWRASGCGMWPLAQLPAALAGGVDDTNFVRRLTGTTWTIEKEPIKQPVKNGRFNVTIELIYELTLQSTYGPRRTPPVVPPTDTGPMLAFTSGTSMAWSRPFTMYGHSFTLASAKQIQGIGAYDAGGDGLQDQVQVVVYEDPGIYIPESGITIENNGGEFAGIYPAIPAGTATPLDGVWRKVDFGNDGATLQPGTYGIFMYLSGGIATSNITMIKNATGLTALAGVTINGPLAYGLDTGEAISTTGDGPGYFGPVLFF